MSAQFGKCNFDGRPVDPQELDRVRAVLTPYGPDAEGVFRKENVGIIYRAFHTTKESKLENQPFVSPSGAVITWDGRLDNRAELIHEFGGELTTDSTDLSIVTSAFERQGTDSFAKLVGDWAVSIWNPRTQSLILAKDFVGTRHLFYSLNNDQVTWSTILDPLVLLEGTTFALCEEYIAGWLSFFPAPQLTPYVGIDSVPPSSFVILRAAKRTTKKYWDFDPGKRVRYHDDGEYEEHFRTVFAEAVRRRLRSDSPILAELSGGTDSSSIVCMADAVIARGESELPRLDTVSYYNDSEPNWNERPYFAKVEEKRARKGCHIDVSAEKPFDFPTAKTRLLVTPSSDNGRRSEARQKFIALITSHGSRVVLSGIGGDEVMGGVPTPMPELEDLLAQGHFRAFGRQLRIWALAKRKPWLHLFFETARAFFPLPLVGLPKHRQPARWLHPDFVNRNRRALTGYDHRLKLFGPLPSFQENISVLDVLRRQLACTAIPSEPPYEQRYPYLDRGLLEFIYAIPRRQLVRPGQRRSLMRRALLGMVPDEILNRKRKAFVVRSPMTSISKEWDTLAEMSRHMVMASLGIIDSTILAEALDNARNGKEGPIVPLIRTVGIEHWLNTLIHQLPDSRTRIHFPGLPCVATKKSGKACHQKTLLASN